MKHWRKGLKRITAVALAVMMIGTTVDASALAVLAAEEVTEVTCNHVCDETCGGMQAVTGSALSVCTHVHDEECGYEEAEAVCTCETDDPAFHATNCPAYIAPENPQCYCAEKCTEDTLNIWCDVCGMQGVSACQGEETAVAYEIVANGTCGAEGNESSVTAFATPEQLMSSDNFALHTDTGSGTAQKVYFGMNGESRQTWYIAGGEDHDGDGTKDSIVLLCDPMLPMTTGCFDDKSDLVDNAYKTYDDNWNCTYTYGTAPNQVYANHYGASDLRLDTLPSLESSAFSTSEQNMMLATKVYTDDDMLRDEGNLEYTYYTTDKLYAAYGVYEEAIITVGENSADSLNSGLKVSLTSGPYTNDEATKFYLRTPYLDQKLSVHNVSPKSDEVGMVSVKMTSTSYAVVPAFRLNLSSVLFASAATAATSDASLTGTMTFRVDGENEIKSEASYITDGVYVDVAEEETVYLYVQGNDGTNDWVYSQKISEDGLVEPSSIMAGAKNANGATINLSTLDLSQCKIWLEKSDNNLAYAVIVHIHEWEYSASGDTITAVCGEADCPLNGAAKTIVIYASDKTYDGTPVTATATVENNVDGTDYSSSIVYKDNTGTKVDGAVNVGIYTANLTLTNEDSTEVTASVEFTIAKGTPDIGTVSASNLENTLDVSQVVLSRSNETVPGTLSLADGTTLQYGIHDYTYVFKSGDANYNDVEGTVSITITDTNAPTATYKVGTDGWKQFINTITFGHFCKDYTTVDITYSDEGSGVADKKYYISEEEITNTENIQWSEYTDTLNINATGKYYIYVRATDNYGNVGIQNSEGIVVYAESAITPTSFSCEYGEENALSINISANGNTFANLTDGSGNEIATDKYSIAGSTLTIKGEYLSKLDVGEYTYKICMNPRGVENTEVTLAYSFVVKVTAKELTVIEATAASRAYIANDKTVDITGVTLSGKQGTDDVSVEITGLKGTLSSANAGTYTSVTLPTVTLTGDDAENYVLVQPTSAVATDVTINKLNPTITVGETEYYKTFGDADFTLDITDDNPEANVTYSSNDENVVVVSNGTVTIKGVGSATITVSMGASTNYNAAVDKTVTVNVARAAYSVDTINKSYLYARSNADSINLAELLPEDCGTVNYASVTSNGALSFISEPKVTNGILAYTLESGAANDTGIIVVDVETQNYEDITITVNVTLTDQIPVNVDGAVELNSNVLTYGETLSGLTFKSVDFVDNAGNEVAGTLAWKEPSATPNAGTTSATWVFTPNNAAYASVEGTVAITVNKATPNVTGVPTVADRVYNPSVVLADSDLTGGTVKDVDGNSLAGSWSWQSTNVVPVVNNSGYIAVFTPTDSTNYETVTRTITVNVTKATPYVATKPTASALTYGQTLNQSVLSNGVIHYSETDSTVVAGSFAWEAGTVKPAVADSNATSYIVVFTPADNTNYNKVEIQITLTVNKAENAPNMPSATMNVSYDTETVGAVTLPTGWEWKTEDVTKTLTIGEAVTAIALYKGTDAGNYETETVEVVITRSTCSHSGGTATCKDKAVCDVCGESYGNVNPANHANTEDTLTYDATGHWDECEGCGEDLNKADHRYTSKVTKQPSYTEKGERTYTCNCGHSYTEELPKLQPSSGGNNGGGGGTSGSGTPEPTATPIPTVTPKPTPAPEKLPQIQDEDGKSGWDVIGDEIEKVIEDAKDSEEKAVVTVDMNGATKVPKDIFEQIAGKDISVEFVLDNGLKWTVNGMSVKADELKDINFGVTFGSGENSLDVIPAKVINLVTGERSSVELQLAHSGEFGFEAVLTVDLEEKNAGLYANLFFYNVETEELEFICSDVIAKDGTADLTFTHASDYLIVLSDTSMEPKDEVEVPEEKDPVLKKGYTVQIGAFSREANAKKWEQKGEAIDIPMFIIKDGKYFKVQTDVFETGGEAVEVSKKLAAAGLDNFVLKTERLVTPGEDEMQETPTKPTTPTTPVLPAETDKKKIEVLAKEVIDGKWGNGKERKDRLTEAGHDYREVQDKVNELLR